MLDHVSLRVSDFARAKKFYLEALKPLNYAVVMEFPEAAGLGEGGKPDFWITKNEKIVPTHVAFVAKDKDMVDAFYKAAIAAGGKDNGAPGTRKEYHPGYYGAFILDPDGNNI